jgi:hypothetical protein
MHNGPTSVTFHVATTFLRYGNGSYAITVHFQHFRPGTRSSARTLISCVNPDGYYAYDIGHVERNKRWEM